MQVPSGAKHGFLNRSAKPASSLIVTTAKLGRFYKEIGRSLDPEGSQQKMPTAHELQHLMDAARRGIWLPDGDLRGERRSWNLNGLSSPGPGADALKFDIPQRAPEPDTNYNQEKETATPRSQCANVW